MLETLKLEVCNANKALREEGLVIFTWGNVSAINRKNGLVVIKPSGVPFEILTPDDMVIVDLEGRVVEGNLKPSCDLPTHLELYKGFNNISAVVHTHSPNATAFAQAKKSIECFGTTHADHFYGAVPVTRELSNSEVENNYEMNTGRIIVKTFNNLSLNPIKTPACLVAGHGPFVWGANVHEALRNAVVLEYIAKMNLKTLDLNPDIKPMKEFLIEKHHSRKHGKNAYYGQRTH